MAREYREKDFDDEVYEDDYYEEHYDEEELEEEGELADEGIIEETAGSDLEENEEQEDDLGEEWDSDKKVTVSFACDDCDYRWDDVIIKKKDSLDDEDEIDAICPMCGSMNVTLI